MSKTKVLSSQEITEMLNLADVDKKVLEGDLKTQRIANKNATDQVLLEKIEMLLLVLESPHIDNLERAIANRKLGRAINRL